MIENAVLFEDDGKWATISEDGLYRYTLGRRWENGALLGWIMLNPSTADATIDDQTIGRCCFYARREGFAGICVSNLYAYRATKPRDLWAAEDPVGPDNDLHITYAATSGGIGAMVAGWGALPRRARPRIDRVREILAAAGRPLLCAGTTKDGSPRHPGRLGNEVPIVEWRPDARAA